MDEMTEVRALRAQAPVPDRARLAAGRARLTDTARDGERRRDLWRRREFAVVAVVAAVTAVAVTAALLVGGTDRGRRVQPTTPDIDLKGMSAHDFLERAADAVDKQPAGTEPTAKQWIYLSMSGHGTTHVRRLDETWTRYDGEQVAYTSSDDGPGLTVRPTYPEGRRPKNFRSPRDVYRFLAALPDDGAGTLKELRAWNAVPDRKGAPQALNDYAEINNVLARYALFPPHGLASLYRALALLPGVEITDHLIDTPTGRKAVAVKYDLDHKGKLGMIDEFLIDPRTYHLSGAGAILYGKVVSVGGWLTVAVVDKAGDRP
ncbi:CU044_5270 family protein [Streptomyces sp. NPDC093970]|uniref:CU044_5270 family protein n=1 Tax=Streptomyces sp. NPDC093970 TaxID=3155076 RepID=UPI0034484F29